MEKLETKKAAIENPIRSPVERFRQAISMEHDSRHEEQNLHRWGESRWHRQNQLQKELRGYVERNHETQMHHLIARNNSEDGLTGTTMRGEASSRI